MKQLLAILAMVQTILRVSEPLALRLALFLMLIFEITRFFIWMATH